MKKIITLVLTGLALLLTASTYAQVGFGTNLPNKSAAVEILSSKRGLLIPRFDIADLSNAAPVTNPANSLFVYNTGATTPAEEGFYYWDVDAEGPGNGAWVKFVSGNNVETTSVTAGTNVAVKTSTSGNNTDYEVSIKAAGTDGYVLVTDESSPGVFTTTWVDPATFVNNVINVGNGLTLNTTTSTVELGGALTKATNITTDATNTLAIKGLADVATLGTEKVVIMDANGILKTTSISNLVNGNAKDMTLSTALEFTNSTDGVGTVLQAVQIGVKADGITATEIATDAVTSDEIADDAVMAADINADVAGTGLTQNTTTGALEVDVTAISGDGEITSSDLTVTGGANSTFTDVDLEIAADAVTTAEIANGTIKTEDLAGTTTGDQVLTTNTTGNPTWVDQSTLVSGNETLTTLSQNTTTGQITYVNENGTPGVTAEVVSTETGNIIGIGTDGGAFLDAAAVQGQQETVTLVDGDNTTVTSINSPAGSNNTEYKVNVSAADIQAAQLTTAVTAGTGINVTPSTAGNATTYKVAADLANITLSGDVTGPANATKVEAIQGVAVSSTAPTAGQVLIYDGTSSSYVPGTATSTVAVDNGLNYDSTADKIQLGGALTEATTITTDATTSKTLAIKGLEAASTANSIVVTEKTTGKLSTVKRAIVTNTAASLNVASVADYSPYVLKLTVLVTISTVDVDVTLPTASADNEGQVINIKIDQTTGDHYVNIKNGTTTITYGALPYQGWTLTSNGTKWVITGRY